MTAIDDYIKTNPPLRRMVVGYILPGNGKVLLGLRKQVTLGLGQNLVAGIGGKVGDKPGLENETADEALEREFIEEVDVHIKSYRLVGNATFLFPEKPKWDQTVDVYIVDAWDKEPTETDFIKPDWYDIDKLPFEQMWDDAHYWLSEALTGKRVKGTFLYGPDNATVVDKKIEIVDATA